MNESEINKSKVMAAAVTLIAFSLFFIPFIYRNSVGKDTATEESLVNLENYSPVIDITSSDDEIIDKILDNQGGKPITVDPEKDNLTEVVGRDLFTVSQYARTDDVSAIDMGESLISNVATALTAKETTNFNLIANPTNTDYKTYGNNLAALHIALIYSEGKEVQYLNEYGAKDDPKYLTLIKPIEARVGEGCALYKIAQVPKDLYELHKKAILLCDQYDIILKSFMKANTDPVRVLAALNMYQTNRDEVLKNMIAYADFFKSKNIIYKPSDLGYLYVNIKNK